MAAAWTPDELQRIAAADELELASARGDGTLSKPVTIWVVRRGDGLYVRSWRGPTSDWFRGVQDRHEGRISAGGVDRDVTFVEAADEAADEIDAAYRTKYHRYGGSYVEPMTRPPARDTTVRLVPRTP